MVDDPLSYDELAAKTPATPQWLWHGYLVPGAITLLTSRWKAGKTTLISTLLSDMKAGGELAGEAVAAGRAIVVSEEAPQLWVQRGRRLDFGSHLKFQCRPFSGKPSHDEWVGLLSQLSRWPAQLTVIDPLSAFLPGSDENNASAMTEALMPLSRLTAAGHAVLLLHHPRKTDGAPRGSGVLPSHADIMLKLEMPESTGVGERKRWLRGAGRYAETPAERLIELSDDGRDYRLVTDAAIVEFAQVWETLRLVFEDTREKLTRRQVLEVWPPDYVKPAFLIVVNWLERGVQNGTLARSGAGRRSDPFRYWLPERESELIDDDSFVLDSLDPLDRGAIRRMASAVLRAQCKRVDERGRVRDEDEADE